MKLNATNVVQTLQTLKSQLAEANKEDRDIVNDMKTMEQKRVKSEIAITETQKEI